jgi:hypothetical protein
MHSIAYSTVPSFPVRGIRGLNHLRTRVATQVGANPRYARVAATSLQCNKSRTTTLYCVLQWCNPHIIRRIAGLIRTCRTKAPV